MKTLREMQMKLRRAKKDDGGFSLVELIIVIAIMAILVGIVGMQVLPYLNKARLAKDQQILSSYSTAAMSAAAFDVEAIKEYLSAGGSVDFYIDGTETADDSSDAEEILKAKINEFAGYDDVSAINWSSKEGQKINYIHVVYDWDAGTLTVSGAESESPDSHVGIDEVVSLGVSG